MPKSHNIPGLWYKTISGKKVKMTKSNSQTPCIVCGDVAFLVNGTCSLTCQNNASRLRNSHTDMRTCQSNRPKRQN